MAVNQSKAGAEELAARLVLFCHERGIPAVIDRRHPLPPEALQEGDLCCVVGGDGTLLGVVEAAAKGQIPVLAINLGKLGFLATANPEDACGQLGEALEGHFATTARSLIVCRCAGGRRYLALNDVVVRSRSTHLVQVDVFANEQFVNRYGCDGVIVTTPTGSTAYNLSAGGPLIHPTARVLAVTPICPHTLSNRALVLDDSARLKISLREDDPTVHATVDGRDQFPSAEDFPLEFHLAEERLLLIDSPGRDYFRLVREKLGWGPEH